MSNKLNIGLAVGTILLGTVNALLIGVSALILSVFLLSRGRAVRGGVVAVFTDDRPACAWRQGPDHLYHATRSAFGRPR